MSVLAKLTRSQRSSGSRLCVGLDPDPRRMPAPLAGLPAPEAALAFCSEIVAATAHVASAFKPNLAFFEALGPPGLRVLQSVIELIGEDHVVIADAKRGDIGSTAEHYARTFFDLYGCDAVTVSPYMGADALVPFLAHRGRMAFSLVLTSNAGAADVQLFQSGGRFLFERVAETAVEAAEGQPGEIGFVVGATWPERLAALRTAFPAVPFLIPGVGAQGGDPGAVIDAAGSGPIIINASRSIIFASSGTDFASAARQAADELAAAMPAP